MSERKMARIGAKSRIVTFRASEDEYETLAQVCLASGARSISEFARAAVMERVRMISAPSLNLSGDLSTLGRNLNELDNALREASKRIRRLLGPVAAQSGTDGTS